MKRGHRSSSTTSTRGQRSPPRPPGSTGGAGGSGTANGRRSAAARSRAIPATHHASGRLASTAMSNTASGPIPSASTRAARAGSGTPARPTRRRHAAEDEDPLVVLGQPELAPRAQHPVGDDAFHLAPADREPAGEHRAHRGEGHDVALVEVPRPAHHLDRLAAGLDHDTADPVGPGDGADLEHAGQDDVAEALARRARPPRRRGRGRRGPPPGRRGRPRRGRSRPATTAGRARDRSDLAQDADVVVEEDPHVGDLVAHLGAAVDAEPEGEPRPLARRRARPRRRRRGRPCRTRRARSIPSANRSGTPRPCRSCR